MSNEPLTREILLYAKLRERVKVLEGALAALVAGVEDSVLRFLESHELQLRHDMEHVLYARVERARAALSPTTDGALKPTCATCGDTGRKFIGAPSEEGTQVWQPCPCGALDLVRVIFGPDCKAAP